MYVQCGKSDYLIPLGALATCILVTGMACFLVNQLQNIIEIIQSAYHK